MRHIHPLAELGARLVEPCHPFEAARRLVDRFVVGVRPGTIVVQLQPAARSEVVETLSQEAAVIRDRTSETPAMNEVKGLGEAPLRLEVIKLELAVGRDPKSDSLSLCVETNKDPYQKRVFFFFFSN